MKVLKVIIPIVLILLYVGCKGLLQVENPNQITDENLNQPTAIPAIVTGIAADFADQYHWTIICSGLLSNELIHIGSFPTFREMHDGNVQDNNITMENWYGFLQRARWVAENGAERIKQIVGEDSARKMIEYAMARIYAGFALIHLADMWDGSPIDGGPLLSRDSIYNRAISHFTEVINIVDGLPSARTFKNGHQTLTPAHVKAIAYLGRARAKLHKGDLSGAYSDVANEALFTGLKFDAVYSENTSRENNLVYIYAYDRPEVAVGPRHQIEGDPRVPVEKPTAGRPYWRQRKYPTRAADIPIVEWQEANLIRAEYFHSQGNITSALSEINKNRRAVGLSDTVVADLPSLLNLIREERKREFFLEGMYLQDLRRFKDPFLQDRMAYFPLGRREKDANPNL
ncbi:MAG: RagB/SusD family nutrient uptake outer membrane protein [Candidatus Kryptonium sp.]